MVGGDAYFVSLFALRFRSRLFHVDSRRILYRIPLWISGVARLVVGFHSWVKTII